MSTKPTLFAGNPNSQYDAGMIAKEVHDYYGQNVRVSDSRTVADQYFTHFRATYTGDLPSEVTYYRGTTQHITQVGCIADSSGSLAGKYFTIYSSPDQKAYYIWFKVSGVGTDPVIANAVGIEIDIESDDVASVVAAAINFTINSSYSDKFIASRIQAVVEIRAFSAGETSNSTSNTSGFTITNTAGTQVVTNYIAIEYSGQDPIYQGQVLKGMFYNIYTGKFEKSNKVLIDDSTPIKVQDIVNTSAIYGSISVSSTPIELKVGSTVLANRSLITLDNTTSSIIYWGYSNSVSSTHFAGRIFKDQQATWAVGDQITIFLVTASATGTAHCSEGS